MRAQQHAAPLVVVRSEADSGRVGLRLIGELDLHTVELLEAELSRSREHSPPSVIDLSELRFLDLVGLRALMRAGDGDAGRPTRVVGATGIVRRIMDLARVLDAESTIASSPPFPCEPSTRVGATLLHIAPDDATAGVLANGASNGASNGRDPAAITTNGKAP